MKRIVMIVMAALFVAGAIQAGDFRDVRNPDERLALQQWYSRNLVREQQGKPLLPRPEFRKATAMPRKLTPDEQFLMQRTPEWRAQRAEERRIMAENARQRSKYFKRAYDLRKFEEQAREQRLREMYPEFYEEGKPLDIGRYERPWGYDVYNYGRSAYDYWMPSQRAREYSAARGEPMLWERVASYFRPRPLTNAQEYTRAYASEYPQPTFLEHAKAYVQPYTDYSKWQMPWQRSRTTPTDVEVGLEPVPTTNLEY